jgi:hypothetical protein
VGVGSKAVFLTIKKEERHMGFFGALQLIFIVLKLVDAIHWHWIYVLLPGIISVGMAILTYGSVLFVYLVGNSQHQKRWKK